MNGYVLTHVIQLNYAQKDEILSNQEFGKFGLDHLREIKKGIVLFNQQKYWECHEELEDFWIENPSDNVRYVFWAIIQIATSMYHCRDGNLIGTQGMLNKARDKILECEKNKVETPLLNEYLCWDKLKNLVDQVPRNAGLDSFKNLYNFRFKPDPSKWDI